ncbi:response regulator transcription factor [Lachnoclostridium sp.]|uniref:response regulator transcription factor n=1 Tax=Lachnoclostridium sp. TaxID=2028282 RepID=UPI00289B2C11|nr:response regulator transcription factor [Lachnoclostridium sp.]
MKQRILVIEDEKSIADAIVYAMKREGFTAEAVYDGEEALKKFDLFKPDAMILDIMLPGINGFEVLKRLESRNSVGIIMLTAKEDIVDKVLGLELGADDYITKPFDMRELLARLRSLLRRLQVKAGSQVQTEIQLDGLMLNLQQRKAVAGEKLLDLTPKEFDLLALLAANPERVYTRDQLLDLIWGMEYMGGTRTVDIHVQRVRKKLGPDYSDILQTIHGVGYKASI